MPITEKQIREIVYLPTQSMKENEEQVKELLQRIAQLKALGFTLKTNLPANGIDPDKTHYLRMVKADENHPREFLVPLPKAVGEEKPSEDADPQLTTLLLTPLMDFLEPHRDRMSYRTYTSLRDYTRKILRKDKKECLLFDILILGEYILIPSGRIKNFGRKSLEDFNSILVDYQLEAGKIQPPKVTAIFAVFRANQAK